MKGIRNRSVSSRALVLSCVGLKRLFNGHIFAWHVLSLWSSIAAKSCTCWEWWLNKKFWNNSNAQVLLTDSRLPCLKENAMAYRFLYKWNKEHSQTFLYSGYISMVLKRNSSYFLYCEKICLFQVPRWCSVASPCECLVPFIEWRDGTGSW